MTSVERVLEYCKLESEAPPETDVKPPKNWPPKGQIKMDNMSFSYHRSLPRVLHHISCCIEPREKVSSRPVGKVALSKLISVSRTLPRTMLIEGLSFETHVKVVMLHTLRNGRTGWKGFHISFEYA